ncbi:MAG: GGDEF domain-containing protein [Lachnospiraceae bacterium]|nr:GGDEF domain-containing protein [Lachnospiraceae bacterium]
MINSKKHKILLNKTDFQVLSADTDFYKFVDNVRFYCPFDKLIYEEDRAKFSEFVSRGAQGWIVIHMLAQDGTAVPCYLSANEISGSDNLEIVLLDVDKVVESEWTLDKRSRVNEAIHGLYGDDSFVYYPDRNEVEIISGIGAHMTRQTMSLNELQQTLEQATEDIDAVNEFISGLRNGSRYLVIKTDGSIKETENGTMHSIIKCTGLYEKGIYTMAVGYIHEYLERNYSDDRKIEIDSLTGLLAKGEITNLAIRTIDVEKRQNVSLAIVDIDHFKQVNDIFGHMTGDNIIRQVASIISEEVGDNGAVGRIGGDEFMILFYNAYDLESSRERLRSIKNTVSAYFPPNIPEQPTVTLSIGCAAYPKDASNYEELFALADFALYRAKEKGRNRYIIYSKELHGTIADIKKTAPSKTRINTRGDLSKGDILCVIMDKVACREDYPIERLLDDYLENFEIPRITVYDAEAGRVLHMAGQKVPSKDVITETEKYILSEYWQKSYKNTEMVINDITSIAEYDEQVYELMKKQGVLACVHIPFKDRKGHRCIFCLEAVDKKHVWNTEQMHYFRLMAKALSEYTLIS